MRFDLEILNLDFIGKSFLKHIFVKIMDEWLTDIGPSMQELNSKILRCCKFLIRIFTRLLKFPDDVAGVCEKFQVLIKYVVFQNN